MQIEINGVPHQKDRLLTTQRGQDELMRAKHSMIRPRCTCSQTKPEMYIAKRGVLYYLARMPGSAKLHARDCQSHVVPDVIYQDSPDAPSDILARLWLQVNAELPEQNRSWRDLRESLLKASASLMVDGGPLQSRLLVPESFDRDMADKRSLAHTIFYTGCDDDDGANRYWTIGIIKELKPSKFSTRMSVRHMPDIAFWVKTEKAQSLPRPTANTNNIQLGLFVCRPVHSGVAVSDIAVIELTSRLLPVSTHAPSDAVIPNASLPALSDGDKLAKITELLGLPLNTTRSEVISQLIDRCLTCNSFMIGKHQ